ncbi:putative chromatin remodelling complex ATPase chain [Wickerhamomyces ciferrii]|uniref:Chromatin remodelling complex ATPase chain n=1 Tax=Wickerhamomyces ciferrii (strain ATCC 14091 / BCRC 22168 / CBS 111 / JCM 3599 / NBRC 0793 / NRRL Y-1031 F-60-10) TaxID=1206466 RepID=K0KE81_WICCF|nr:putative chromatin remodelling complex ATPase chain [Wickerhamomyces ciferrii]CCH40552.1 putative chromatin remodelling complex ATPase chain [Wickerhamomyces ciferrii]
MSAENVQLGANGAARDESAGPVLPTPDYEESPAPVEFDLKSLSEKQKTYFVDQSKSKFNVEETAKRFKYLLGLTDLFSHFINNKAEKDPRFRQVLNIIEEDKLKSKKSKSTNNRRRKTEKEEDAELLQDEEDENNVITEFAESPAYVQGELRSYQIAGLNWLISLHENNISGILADEMGLGKTLQTISFLGYLRYIRNIQGPHLVVVPKSTLDNWAREFAKWTPDVNAFVLQGDKEQRADIVKNKLYACDFDVCITSYEIVIKEKAHFRKFDWQYIIIDEAHRIKNEESMLSQIIRMFHSKNRLLITGTPLQNNLHELWALLNFILPDVFSDSEAFDQWFIASNEATPDPDSDKATNESNKQDQVVQQLHKVLKPFLLRRIKNDVEKSLLPKKEVNLYIGMSEMQRKWYQSILEKDIDAVNGANGKRESKTRLLNIVMQLRKCCNHPYLFEGAEPGPPYTTDEHLVYNAQKLKVLDKLLKKLKKEGSRVLIFSQMSRLLDILEDYCNFRDYQYCRIDGQTDHSDRIKAIDEYNAPDSEKFVFLLTTRAGGLGINLTSADVVVLYDSDWNPQADLQAMDRAHRIGQTKQVKVFRLVTENAIEEKVLERATQKLRLDQLVIQQGRNAGNTQAQSAKGNSKDDLLNMIQFGASDVFNSTSNGDAGDDDFDLDAILEKSESKTSKLSERYSKLGLDELQKFASDSAYEWNGEDFKKKDTGNKIANLTWINPAKRERKENYSIDMYYKDVLHTGGRTSNDKKGPKAPRQPNIFDHQFYPIKLQEIFDREKAYYKKTIGYKVPLPEGPDSEFEQREAEQRLLQLEIKNSTPLTEEEEAEKAELLTQGYGNWTRREFTQFIQVCAKFGRNSISAIATEFPDKTIDEVRDYAKAFWENYNQIDGFERYISQIENGEDKIRKGKLQKECLRIKLSEYSNPLHDLTLKFPPATTNRRVFSEEEDRYILVQLYRFGLDRVDLFERIRDGIRSSPLFRFDFFFQSRTTAELSRRAQTLLACVVKEIEGGNKVNNKKRSGGDEFDDEYEPKKARGKNSKGGRK